MQKVLLIDDDVAFVRTWKKCIESWGYDVTATENSEEGMELLEQGQFDLIVSDIIMPKRDGIEVFFSALSSAPDSKFIAISGGGRIDSEHYLKMARVLGAVATLSKPFTEEELKAAFRKVFEEG